MGSVRLDRFLANAGCGTRSEVKKYIRDKLITVDQEVVRSADLKVDPQTQDIRLRGQRITERGEIWLMLHKPEGTVTAARDADWPVVMDLLKGVDVRDLFPVGRLDRDTEGLLLITNNGELSHRLLSPRSHVDKTYLAVADGAFTPEDIRLFEQGVDIGDEKLCLPAELIDFGPVDVKAEVSGFLPERSWPEGAHLTRITVREGRFHQVKRMYEAAGRKVLYLKRLSMGGVSLDPALEPGEFRALTPEERESLE